MIAKSLIALALSVSFLACSVTSSEVTGSGSCACSQAHAGNKGCSCDECQKGAPKACGCKAPAGDAHSCDHSH
jgi:hypothetical protein